jgi:hypothetical protein
MARAAAESGCGREAWAAWRVLRTRVGTADDAEIDAPLALALLRVFCAGGTAMAAPAWDVFVSRVHRAPGPLPSFAALAAWVDTQPAPAGAAGVAGGTPVTEAGAPSSQQPLPPPPPPPSPRPRVAARVPPARADLLADVAARLADVLPARRK